MANLDPWTRTFSVTRTARKTHKCAICRNEIEPGMRYVDEVMPPWIIIRDDPESFGAPLGEWERSRYHMVGECRTRPMPQPSIPPIPADQRPAPKLPPSLDPSNRYGGGDPLSDYLHAKGEL